MCTSTNRMKMIPLAAMISFSAIVERVVRTPLTRSVVATAQHDTRGDLRPGTGGGVRYAPLPTGRRLACRAVGRPGPAARRGDVVGRHQLVDGRRPAALERQLAGPRAEVPATR